MEFLLIIVGILCLIIAFIWHKIKKENEKSRESQKKEYNQTNAKQITTSHKTYPKPKVVNKSISFKVAGVTKNNEEGKNIQAILKRIANQYKREGDLESFDGMTNKEIIEDYFDNIGEFESQYINNKIELVLDEENEHDKNAIKVYLSDINDNKHHIGFVKRDSNKKLKYELQNNELVRSETEFTGGKYKYVDYDDYKDKDIITTDEITRGLWVRVVFENEVGVKDLTTHKN